LLSHIKKLKAGLVAVTAVAALALGVPSGASANASASCNAGGGVTPEEVNVCAPTPKARLLKNGMLIAPASAPPRVKQVIAYANRIRTKPYIWGGGHARWWDRGYDCSGSVSYALHGGNFISSPMPSGPMEHWGLPGEGRWITVWANSGHAYAEIAGFRWDTAGDTSGTGPRWHAELLDNEGFVPRHPPGY
jgi:hypothetical protein